MKEVEQVSPKNKFLQQFKDSYGAEFFPTGWTPEERNRVDELTSSTKTKTMIFSAIPMVCHAESCMFASTCPLLKENLAPLGKSCPIEMMMVINFMADYMEQLNIDDDNLVELSMIRDLVDQEVQYLRKTKMLAKESFIQENIVGIDSDGDPVMRKELHLAVELEDRLLKRRQAIFKQLLATREAKAKVGLAALDQVQSMSNLVMHAKELQDQRDKALKQKLGIVDHDDYIDAYIVEQEEDKGQ